MNNSSTLDLSAPVPLKQDASVIALVGMAHSSSHFSQMLLPPLFPLLMRDFGLSFSQVGLLMTVFFVVSGIGQMLAGFVVDKVGARPILLASPPLPCAGLVPFALLAVVLWMVRTELPRF